MAAKELPDQATLLRLLRYDPATGFLYWRKRTPKDFSAGQKTAEHQCNAWNAKFSGNVALHSIETNGYRHGPLLGTTVKTHRVIWKILHGTDPDQIDHINGIRADNRQENLRDVSQLENHRNQKIGKNNKSGIIGVCWHEAASKWAASIMIQGRSKYLGLFDNKHDAGIVRANASKKFGFHENHGRK